MNTLGETKPWFFGIGSKVPEFLNLVFSGYQRSFWVVIADSTSIFCIERLRCFCRNCYKISKIKKNGPLFQVERGDKELMRLTVWKAEKT